MFLVVPPLVGRPVERMLVIGNAGGTIARAFAEFYPAVRIDGVELDEAVTDAGRRYLGLDDNPRLRVVAADGRPYLRATERRYDVIVVDAFRGQYVPFYLTTTEFFELARSRLTPGGIVAMNVGGLPGDDDLTRALESTVAASFPQAWGWTPLRYNELVLGLDRATPRAELARRAERVPGRADVLGRLFAASVRPLAIRERPLTDDRAPVEWLTDRLIVESLSDRELDEEYLPTRP
jgi:precorrin-6B methylase 2